MIVAALFCMWKEKLEAWLLGDTARDEMSYVLRLYDCKEATESLLSIAAFEATVLRIVIG